MGVREGLDALYREHAVSLIASLVRASGGRVDWAETAVQDAFERAISEFDAEVPARPVAWLHRVARNRLVDIARRYAVRLDVEAELAEAATDHQDPPPPVALGRDWNDELLRMIVASCHLALTPDEQVTIALRILFGVPQASIAAIFRAPEDTVKKRVTSAKRKLRELGRLDVPGPEAIDARLDAALRVLYVAFTEGHKPRSGAQAVRVDLCTEAIRLGEIIASASPRRLPEVHALLALMKLSAARLPARLGDSEVVLLEEQDRGRWDRSLIDAGLLHLRASASGDHITPYHHEATIAACHALADDFASTDWTRIVAAYDALLASRPSVVLEVNRAVAVGFALGFEQGLRLLRGLPKAAVVAHLPYHAAVGSMAQRAGHFELATSAYRIAANLSQVDTDRRYFERKSDQAASGDV